MQSTNAADIELTSIKELDFIDTVVNDSNNELSETSVVVKISVLDDPTPTKQENAATVLNDPPPTTATAPTKTAFNMENPMHSPKKMSGAAADDVEDDVPPNTDSIDRGKCTNSIKGLTLFIITAVAVGFFYVVAQAVASATSEDITIRWWFKVDGMELMFYLFVLSAVLHFVINAGGSSTIKYWSTFVPLTLIVGFILISGVPDVYRQSHNSTESVGFDRGGCQSVEEADQTFDGLLLDACRPMINPDRFIRYDFDQRTKEETSLLLAAIGTLNAFASSNVVIPDTVWRPELGSFMNVAKCAYKMSDILCADATRKCNPIDCSLPPSSCVKNKIVEVTRDWKDCAIQACTYDPQWCANINDQTMVDDVLPATISLFTAGLGTSFVNQEVEKTAVSKITMILNYFNESMSTNLTQKCHASIVEKEQHRDGSMNTNMTCDITKQKYERVKIKTLFNSAVMMSLVCALFGCSIVLIGDFESLHFHLSAVRVGCCLVCLLMSALVYVGSLHLYWSSIGNPVQTDADLQLAWRSLYLTISYMCLHGGLLVLVPRVGVVVDETKDQPATVNHDSLCSVCGSTTCCRRDSCCFKTVLFVRSLKEELWDASGAYFSLKLVLMEIIEIAIQLNSLASGAKTSHVNDVVLSAIIISANLIVLPLVIVLGPKCIHKTSASSNQATVAAVMVVEVLFDKLYVGVGVLFRYDILIQRNMKLTDSIAVHLALLLPALMTALDVQDALVLAEEMEFAAANSSDNVRSTSFARVAGKVDNVTHSPVVLMVGKGGLLSSIILGIVLATYTLTVSTTARIECEHRIGKISSCASEQYYFTNGFFANTDCAFEQVTSFKCNPEDSVAVLPDAVDDYASMTKLVLINISNSNSLKRAPLGWAYVPNEKLIIDIHGSEHFADLPFQLCTSHTNLTTIDLRGTAAETTMNWNGQLATANFSSFDMDSLNDACVVALHKLTSLSLADNNLTLSQIDDALMLRFDSLVHLNLQNNSITEISVPIGDSKFTPILQRYTLGPDTTKEGGLQLYGNPIKRYRIRGEIRETIVDAWIQIYLSLSNSVVALELSACGISNRQLRTIGEARGTRMHLKELDISVGDITDMKILSTFIHLEALSLSASRITDFHSLKYLVKLKRLHLKSIKNGGLTHNTLRMLGTFINLQTLHVAGNGITTVESLAALVNLRALVIYDNSITNVTCLSSLEKLQYLFLADNLITDVSSLNYLADLKALSLNGNPVNKTDPSVILLQEKLGLYNIFSEEPVFLKLLDHV